MPRRSVCALELGLLILTQTTFDEELRSMWLPSLFRRYSLHSDSRGRRGGARRSKRIAGETLENRWLMAGNMSASLIADISPGLADSSPQSLTAVNDTLYF